MKVKIVECVIELWIDRKEFVQLFLSFSFIYVYIFLFRKIK